MSLLPIKKEHPTKRWPWALYLLIAINVLVFLLMSLFNEQEYFYFQFGFIPARHVPLTWFTHMFLHAGFWHILGNMFFLWMFGSNVEDLLGGLAFLVVYLLSGLGAVAIYTTLNWHSTVPLVGASGAISGVLGLYLAFFPRVRIDLEVFILYWNVKTFETNALWAIAAWFVYQLLMAILVQTGLFPVHIAFLAHVGGLLTGLLIGLLLVRLGVRERYERLVLQAQSTPPRIVRKMEGLAERADTQRITRLVTLIGSSVLVLLAFASLSGKPTLLEGLGLNIAPLLRPPYVQEETPVPVPETVISPKTAYDVAPLARWDAGTGTFSMTFNPDGMLLATGGGGGRVEIRRVADGHLLRVLDGPTEYVYSLAFSPDGKLLAAGGGSDAGRDQVSVWQVDDGSLVRLLETGFFDRGILFSSNHTLLDWGLGGTVQSWDVQHGTLQGSHEADSETTDINTVAVSSDGELVASAPLVALDDFAIQVWRMANGEMVQVLPVMKGGLDEGIVHMAFCSDKTLLASVDRRGITRIWNLSDGHLLQTLDQSEADAKRLAFSPDCKIMATADDSAVRLWRVSDGSLLLPLYHPLAGKDSLLSAIAFSPDGRLLASAANEGTIRLWGVPLD